MPVDIARWKELKEKERLLKEAADAIRTQEKHLPKVVQRFKDEIKEMEKKIEEF